MVTFYYSTCIKPKQVVTLVLLNPDNNPAFANSIDPDQLASKKPTDLDLHCLPFIMWIYINNLDQVIWLAENEVGVAS